MTLYELVTRELNRQQRKHDLGEDYAEKFLNRLSNTGLLEFVSERLEEDGVTFGEDE